jgi:hypothetical protein
MNQPGYEGLAGDLPGERQFFKNEIAKLSISMTKQHAVLHAAAAAADPLIVSDLFDFRSSGATLPRSVE